MIYKAPEKRVDEGRICIFLAGTIDMGNSRNWQEDITRTLVDKYGDKVDIFNPRRDDWDGEWKQTKDNPEFNKQVNWELDALDDSHIIIMNLLPGSASPISLLELGLYADNCLVCCPDGFYRKGNVDIVCEREGVRIFESESELMNEVCKIVDVLVDGV